MREVAQLARDLDLKTRIVGVPIVRERDGVALSSRNRYLTAAERQKAPMLYRALKDAAAKIGAGAPIAKAVEQGRNVLAQGGFQVDYFDARNADTLEPLKASVGEPVRLLAAARLGTTRLIDNIAV